MSFKVVMTLEMPAIAQVIEQYKKAFPQMGADFAVKNCSTEDEIIDFARDADAVIIVGQPITRKVIMGLSNCKLISSIGIGYDTVDVDAAAEYGICVNNVPDYCLEEVSDHAMALLLACSRGVVKLDRAVKAGKWLPLTAASEIQGKVWPSLSRLRGQTLGLVGFGRVPRTLVPKAKGFGLRVIACDPHVPSETFAEMGVEMVDLDRLLAESDFVSAHAALTAETQHMLGAEQFAKMKPTAWLINTARGGVVDGRALYTALQEGKLVGAALDVTEPEPPDPDDPLPKLDNVIVTAHSAHASPLSWVELWRRPIEEVGRIMQGMWPRGLVNLGVKETYAKRWGAPLK